MLRTVVLHGPLRAAHDGPISVVANTVAEAIELISRQLPGLAPNAVTGRRNVRVVGCETKEDLYRPLGDQVEIHLVPEVALGKDQGWTQVIIGYIQITIGTILLFVPGTQGFGIGLILSGSVTLIGGIVQLLAPTPPGKEEEKRSQVLGTPPNTVGIGVRIPLLLGRHLAQGHFLSLDIDAVQLSASGAQRI